MFKNKKFIVNYCLSYFLPNGVSIIYHGQNSYFDWNLLHKNRFVDHFVSWGKYKYINMSPIHYCKNSTIRIVHCKPISSILLGGEGFKLSVTVTDNDGNVSLFYPSSNVRDISDFEFRLYK